MRVFVSCQAVDGKEAAALIHGLRMAGMEVEHSPRNPEQGPDPRWQDWYQTGLSAALANCEVFVIVLDIGWDSSTWMAIEADMGMSVPPDGSARRAYFWNPQALGVRAAGMLPYLKHELPRSVEDAIRIISES